MSVSESIDRDILSFFKKLEDKSTDHINKLIVSSFVKSHRLKVGINNYLYRYLITGKDVVLNKLNNIISQTPSDYGIEELVEIFEFVISPADKEVNGAVYTPEYIREAIIRRTLSRYDSRTWHTMLYADLSCGCGGFFYSLIKIIRENNAEFSICEFVRWNILGVDIKKYSVERTKILLSLYALLDGEELQDEMFNILCQNTLSNTFTESPIVQQHGGIDVIIGNPPYVASSKMSEENKKYVKNWTVSKTGKSDLYLPFFQIGLESLKRGGTLGYITVNSFYRSLNGGAFRSYLSDRRLDCTIIDFGAEQLFKGCSTYTCICIINNNNTGLIHYQETTSDGLLRLKDHLFEDISYSSLENKKGWVLKDKNTASKIKAIESVGNPLGEVVVIKNGLATLRNDIYILKPLRTDRKYVYFKKNGMEHQVEHAICRKIIKANIVRRESDIKDLSEYIIFPYRLENGLQNVISEEVFQRNYPMAYNYLASKKDELAKRDKGHKTYPKWYAYGRSQALNLSGERLLVPHICDTSCFIYCANKSILFYDGYSIFAESPRKLEVVRKILTSNLFWYYITKTSKPYSGGFFSLEKRYIQHFGLPVLSKEQEDELLSFEEQDKVNNWLEKIYGINI